MKVGVFLFDADVDRWEYFDLALTEAMPYSGGTLSVDEFWGNSHSDFVWSDKKVLEAFRIASTSCLIYCQKRLRVHHAFRRIADRSHAGQSMHYAGLALDMGKNLSKIELRELKRIMRRQKIFSHIEPDFQSPFWIHAECNFGFGTNQYPSLSYGAKGPVVFVLQDALRLIGDYHSAMTGEFDLSTQEAVARFQFKKDILVTGTADSVTWKALFQTVHQSAHAFK